ncbi:hypothetical protein GXB84_06175 [Stenotrophomonas acidaminiphila]|uniref:hypothetical protein n=1 Tax=Stenotrophomonas acidaminiphila TaxID=128780 RepID=UPI00137557B2|nr:hypothetical protein [Stenotrophomonas acidaminiphila]NCT86916.1 hypothetical protein [Stenotrophomonas acidaminiphila]
MLIGFRVTRGWVVNIIVAAILARLFFMGMDGVDRFSSDWNRVTGASMPGSSGVRDVVTDVRSTSPSELDEFLARAEADANRSRSLLDVLKSLPGVPGLPGFGIDASTTPDQPLSYGAAQQLESPYDRYAE